MRDERLRKAECERDPALQQGARHAYAERSHDELVPDESLLHRHGIPRPDQQIALLGIWKGPQWGHALLDEPVQRPRLRLLPVRVEKCERFGKVADGIVALFDQ